MARKPTDSFGKFLETNPTTEQAIIANRARDVMNQGRSPNAILDASDLTPEQKKLIIQEYQADLIESQKNPQKTKPLSQMLKDTPETKVSSEQKNSSIDRSQVEYMPIRDIAPDVAEYLDISVDSLISKGRNKNDIVPRVLNKIEENLGRSLSTIESEHI